MRALALAPLCALLAGCGGSPKVERPATAQLCPAIPDLMVEKSLRKLRPRTVQRRLRRQREEIRRKQFDARQILGMSERDATTLARRHGCVIRQVNRGEGYAYTSDLRYDRIDVDIEDGVVTRIDEIG